MLTVGEDLGDNASLQMPRTLVLHPRFDEDSQHMWEAAVAAGWSIERLNYSDPLPERIDAIYGGYMWGAEIAQRAHIRLDTPAADYLWRLPFDWVKRSAQGVIGRALPHYQFPQFVKAEDRSITSRVYHSVADLPPNIGPDSFYTIQEPVHWSREYRCFVVGDQIVASSSYARDGELWVDRAPFTDNAGVVWLRRILPDARRALPHSAVIDIGWIANRGWAIVEANASWCSGIYGCHPPAVLEAVAAAVNRTPEDLL